MAWGYWPGCYRPQAGLGILAWLLQPTQGTGLAATANSGYRPCCYSPQVGLGGTALGATGPRLALGYWPGYCSPHRVLAWLLQPTVGTGQAATAHRGYWPGCYSPQDGLGVLAWLLQPPEWPGDTGLDATAHRGYWPGCFSPQNGKGVQAWLLQGPG